jgi:hypothetical protein
LKIFGENGSGLLEGVLRAEKFTPAQFHYVIALRSNNRSVTTRARLPVVPGQQMRNKRIDFRALVPRDLAVFVKRNVLAPAQFFRAENGLDSFQFQPIVQFALPFQGQGTDIL